MPRQPFTPHIPEQSSEQRAPSPNIQQQSQPQPQPQPQLLSQSPVRLRPLNSSPRTKNGPSSASSSAPLGPENAPTLPSLRSVLGQPSNRSFPSFDHSAVATQPPPPSRSLSLAGFSNLAPASLSSSSSSSLSSSTSMPSFSRHSRHSIAVASSNYNPPNQNLPRHSYGSHHVQTPPTFPPRSKGSYSSAAQRHWSHPTDPSSSYSPHQQQQQQYEASLLRGVAYMPASEAQAPLRSYSQPSLQDRHPLFGYTVNSPTWQVSTPSNITFGRSTINHRAPQHMSISRSPSYHRSRASLSRPLQLPSSSAPQPQSQPQSQQSPPPPDTFSSHDALNSSNIPLPISIKTPPLKSSPTMSDVEQSNLFNTLSLSINSTSKSASSSSSRPSTRQRTAMACQYCRKRKVKCSKSDLSSGTFPDSNTKCTNCVRYNQECIFTPVSCEMIPVDFLIIPGPLASVPPSSDAGQSTWAPPPVPYTPPPPPPPTTTTTIAAPPPNAPHAYNITNSEFRLPTRYLPLLPNVQTRSSQPAPLTQYSTATMHPDAPFSHEIPSLDPIDSGSPSSATAATVAATSLSQLTLADSPSRSSSRISFSRRISSSGSVPASSTNTNTATSTHTRFNSMTEQSASAQMSPHSHDVDLTDDEYDLDSESAAKRPLPQHSAPASSSATKRVRLDILDLVN